MSNRDWLTAIVVVVLVGVLWYSGHSGVRAQQDAVCSAVNNSNAVLANYINTQLNRAGKTLPTIEYYQRHPVELGRQLQLLERQRRETAEAFKPVPC